MKALLLTVAFQWALIGNPGNIATDKVTACCDQRLDPIACNGPGDPHECCVQTGVDCAWPTTGYGEVEYEFYSARHEVTVGQYLDFLNAIADADPNGVYKAKMATGSPPTWATFPPTIDQIGSSPNFSYTLAAGASENWPVLYINYLDMLRFVNWLENGQPVNVPQDASSTENGVYDLADGILAVRNPSATFWILNEDELVKAAFYDPTHPDGYRQWAHGDTACEGYLEPDALMPHHCDNCPIRDVDPPDGFHEQFAVSCGNYIPGSPTPGVDPDISQPENDGAPKPVCSYPSRSYYGLCGSSGGALEIVEYDRVTHFDEGGGPAGTTRSGPWWQANGDQSLTGRGTLQLDFATGLPVSFRVGRAPPACQ